MIPLLSSSLWALAQTPVIDATRLVLPWSTCPLVPMLHSGCLGMRIVGTVDIVWAMRDDEKVRISGDR